MKVANGVPESGSPSGRPPVKVRSAFTLKGTSASPLPGASHSSQSSPNGKYGRSSSTIRQSSSTSSFQNQQSAFKKYPQPAAPWTPPPKYTTSAYHKDKQKARQTPSPPQQTSVLTSVPQQGGQSATPPQSHRYEQAMPVSMENKGDIAPVLPQVGSYDTLAAAREEAGTVRSNLSGSLSPRRSESPKSSEEEIDNVFSPIPGRQSPTKSISPCERKISSEIEGVELRTKKSVSPLGEEGSSNLDKGTRLPPTKNELHQLKKLAREPLINVSDFTQRRRNAEYVDIDLPKNRSSDSFSERTDSMGSSLYSVPSSASVMSSAEQVYDIPTSTRHSNAGIRHVLPDAAGHYDIPQAAMVGGGSRLSAQIAPPAESHYDTPRSSAISRSKSPPQRALPHRPDDYVNIVPGEFKRQGSGKSKSESGVEGVDEGDELYSEIPATGPVWGIKMGRVSSAGKLSSTTGAQGIDIYSDLPEIPNVQPGLKRFSKLDSQSQVESNGEKIAKKLADAGYEFVHPANAPAIISPPAELAGMKSPFSLTPARGSSGSPPMVGEVSDEYVELQRQDVATTGDNYMNIPSGPISKRGKDGYEIVDANGLRMKHQGGAKPQQQPAAESDSEYANPSVSTESTMRVEQVQQRQSQGKTASVYMNVGVGSRSRKKNDGYEEVKDRFPNTPLGLVLSRTPSPPESQPQATPANQTTTKSPSDTQPISSTMDADHGRNSSELGDILEGELMDEGPVSISSERHVPEGDEDDEYILMRPVEPEYVVMKTPISRTNSTRTNSSSTTNSTGSPEPSELAIKRRGTQSNPLSIPEKLLVPTAVGSPDVGSDHPPRLRKRSLTVGDPLDGSVSEPKKHTYINIPDETLAKGFNPPRSYTDPCVGDKLIHVPDKKPMPLPRQSSLKQSSPPLADRHQQLVALHENAKTLPSLPLHRNEDKNGRLSPLNGHVEMESSSSKVKSIIRQFSSSSSSPSTSPCTSPKTNRRS